MTEKTRYTDEELEEFRALINEKLARAEREYENLCASLRHDDGNGVADTSPTLKTLEDGAYVLNREESARLAERQRVFINHLRAALVRIDNKTYGICRAPGKLIPKERLRVVPHATLSIEGKEQKR